MEQLRKEIENAEDIDKRLQEEIVLSEIGREESDEREQVLKQMHELEDKIKEVDVELSRFAEFDPEEIEKVKEKTKTCMESANRWIDNIFNLQSWANKTFSMEKKDFAAQFEIPEDLDYVE